MKLKHKLLTILMLTLASTLLIFTACEDEDDDPITEEPTNSAPTCTITNPEDDAEFTQGETITIAVEAEDEDNNLEEVRFYVNGIGIGSATSFPYNFEWNTSEEEPGSFTIKAEAIDEAQEKASDEINITLTTSGGGGGSGEFELITVSGGTFEMGCTSEQNNCGGDETPVHTVTVDDFQMSKYEITNQQYADFMNEIGAESSGSYNGTEYLDMDDSDCQINYSSGQFVTESGKENFPVIEVTWYGAKAFCEHYGGRLPTEAEWEFAARGGNSATATLYAGSDNIGDVAWYWDNSGGHTHEVGTRSPNELGIYDMSGNVWEWCNDWYDGDYYSSSPQNNPQGPSSGSGRVLRGGSWYYNAGFCRVANRSYNNPDYSRLNRGFRLVVVP